MVFPSVMGSLSIKVIMQLTFYCKKDVITNATIQKVNSAMKCLTKTADLNDLENVKKKETTCLLYIQLLKPINNFLLK
jgi:hypothetical protein